MTSTVLVVGATGNIGREIVAALAAQPGVAVVAGARDAGAAAERFRHLPAVRAAALDAEDPRALEAALAGVQKVALVSPLRPDLAASTARVVDAAKRAGVRQLVRCSLIGADEPDPIAEARWHADADAAVRASGIPFTILAPTQYLQNFLGFGNLESVRDAGVLSLPLGEARVSNIDTRDIGAAAAGVLTSPAGEHDGRTYTLTGGESMTMDEIAEALSRALERPVRYVAADPAARRDAMISRGIPAVITDAILEWFAYCRAGRADRVDPALERLLGRRPITVAQFARDHAARYR